MVWAWQGNASSAAFTSLDHDLISGSTKWDHIYALGSRNPFNGMLAMLACLEVCITGRDWCSDAALQGWMLGTRLNLRALILMATGTPSEFVP